MPFSKKHVTNSLFRQIFSSEPFAAENMANKRAREDELKPKVLYMQAVLLQASHCVIVSSAWIATGTKRAAAVTMLTFNHGHVYKVFVAGQKGGHRNVSARWRLWRRKQDSGHVAQVCRKIHGLHQC